MVKLLQCNMCRKLVLDADPWQVDRRDVKTINLFLVDDLFRAKIWDFQIGYYANYHLAAHGIYCAYDLDNLNMKIDKRRIKKFYKIFIYGIDITSNDKLDITTKYLIRFCDDSYTTVDALPLFSSDHTESVRDLKNLSYYKIKKYCLTDLKKNPCKYFDIIGFNKNKILCAIKPDPTEADATPKINKLLKKYHQQIANANYTYLNTDNKILLKN